MNRWWGSSQDADDQRSSRNQRAARRYIRSNIISSEEEEFDDANSSLAFDPNINLDGETAGMAPTEDERQAEAARIELARQKRLPVAEADFDDDDDAWKKEIKIKFDMTDVTYWFNSVESQMKKFGINSQWSKKDSILTLLPEEVIEECKPILRLTQEEAGDNIYKSLKTECCFMYSCNNNTNESNFWELFS